MTTAAEQVAGNEYLVEEILIRLPAKSVTRSKLVSKQWLSQISEPQFVDRHSRRKLNKSPTGMFLKIKKEAIFVSLNDLNPTYQTIPSLGFLYDATEFNWVILLMSCNGLLLCLVSCRSEFQASQMFCVCNPTTRKFRLLPGGPFLVSSIRNACLAFYPSISLHYKVICTRGFADPRNDPFEMLIFSSENQSWRTYASPFDPRGEAFFFNGSIYFPSAGNTISCFDVYNEMMKQITVPPLTQHKCLPVFGSSLYCIDRKGVQTTDFSVLEMSSDFSDCVTKYDVSVRPLVSAFPEIAIVSKRLGNEYASYYFDATCVVEGVREDEPGLVLQIPRRFLLFNLKEKTAKELCKVNGRPGFIEVYRVYQFTESLSVV